MKIRVLGAGSGLPMLGKHLACIHVESGGQCFIFDCGDGSIYRLLAHKIGAEDIDAVVITHYHPDHVAGIFMLVQMLYLQGRKRELPLFLPEREAEFAQLFSMFYSFPERMTYKLKVHHISILPEHFPQISIAANDHLQGYREIIKKKALSNCMQAYSLKVSSPKGNFVYSADLETTDSIQDFIQNVHTIVVDGGHPALAQIEKLKDYGIKRILLNHGTPQATVAALCKGADSPFHEVQEDLCYEI